MESREALWDLTASTLHVVSSLLCLWVLKRADLDIGVGVGACSVSDEHGIALREVARPLRCWLHLRVEDARKMHQQQLLRHPGPANISPFPIVTTLMHPQGIAERSSACNADTLVHRTLMRADPSKQGRVFECC